MNEQTSITQDLESLFKKTTEANKIFFSESAKFIKNISASNIKGEDIFATQTRLFKDALNLFVKLNIQHTSNLIDLGVAISKKMNGGVQTTDGTSGDDETVNGKPAFVLNVSAPAGTTATTQFLLDSSKNEPIQCSLRQTEYIYQNDPSIALDFATQFSPQSFQLDVNEAEKVEINIKIPAGTKEGVYLTNVHVDGFEHTYFSLFINVTPYRDTNLKSTIPDSTLKTRKRKSK